jgi:putative transposase
MTTPARARYAGYRFPAEIIGHAVWLYFRFPLGLRMVEELLAARGIVVSHKPSDNGRASSVVISPTKSAAAFPGSATNGISMRVCRERTTSNGSAELHRR